MAHLVTRVTQVTSIEKIGGVPVHCALWLTVGGDRLSDLMVWPDWFAARLGGATLSALVRRVDVIVTSIAEWDEQLLRRRWNEGDVCFVMASPPAPLAIAHRLSSPPVKLSGLAVHSLLHDALYVRRRVPMSILGRVVGTLRKTDDILYEYRSLVHLYRAERERDYPFPATEESENAECQ